MTLPAEVDAVIFDCDRRCDGRILRHAGAGPVLAQRLYDLVDVELAGGASALTGARELVLAVRERRPIAVASNSPRPFVTAALASAGLADLFTHSLAADDVEHAKPAPDLYLAACARLGADPARSVAFEDSRTGVASARAAGLFVVGVPSLPGVELEVDAPLRRADGPSVDRLAQFT